MRRWSRPEISTSTWFRILPKIWLSWKKESKYFRINSKFWKIKVHKNIKPSKIIITSNNFKSTKEIKPRLNLINMNWKKNKKNNLLIKTSMKYKSLTWSFFHFKKTCKILDFSTNKLVRIEITLVFSWLIEMINSVYFMRSQTCRRIF